MKDYSAKIISIFILTLGLFIFNSCSERHIEQLTLANLRCEMLTDPAGIDTRNPRLSWMIESGHHNILQKYYQVIVASSLHKLENNVGDLWNSGKVKSGQSVHIEYNGKPLNSNQNCFWKVKVWSENGESEWSRTAFWRMGLLNFKDWKGRWIGLDRSFPWDDESKHARLSARYFRKEFNTSSGEIKSATLYLIGLGLYELYINGKKSGDQVLAPSPTDFAKNIKYNSFDITEQLVPGTNAIGVALGNGYFYTMRQNYKPYKIKTFGYPKLLLNLIIEYKDGTFQTISTDNTWKVTANGPIRVNNLYDGEEYDARKETLGWNNTGFNDADWLQAEYVQEPGGEIEAQMNENMKVMDMIEPVSVSKISGNRFILDMGQNMAGWLRIKVNGQRGQKVTLRFAESLQENGELFTANLRDAKATDVYILNGEGEETWEPSFVYHGFRYVELTGYPGIPEPDNFKGCVVYDNIKTTGSFETSDSLINHIYRNAVWTINSSYKGMLIDCPQRNERMPWLGDRAVGCYNESFVFDNSRLYSKWLDDILYTQKADGCLADVAPAYYKYYSDNMTWPGTYILVAEMLYHQYGLTKEIEKHYPYMKKWMMYMKERYLIDYILTKDSYGDWCAPPKTIEEGRGKSADVKRPSQLIATAYFYHLLQIMQNFAKITGQHTDINDYMVLADSVKTAFNKKFYLPDSSFYGNGLLTENMLPIAFKMVPDEYYAEVVKTVHDIIEIENNGHLSSGLVGMQWLMRTLTDNGLENLAFNIATKKTYPGWGYMIENGATTIWELWNANTAAPSMNSQNHVMMLGDLIIWYYEYLAGIKSDREFPGFKQIILNPLFIKELDCVNASFHSVHGLIKSHWKREDGALYWDVQIPPNTTCLIYFPVGDKNNITENDERLSGKSGFKYLGEKSGRVIYKTGSGNYQFKIEPHVTQTF
ncbi:MAG: glycoside hydrolase family 78 protein [Bacteroidales bacterium]|nr:glycoside hydrolase family 78 protein [Bacteroidales bacterium]